MEGYKIVLLLLVVVGVFIILRSLMKPAVSNAQIAVTTVKSQGNKFVSQRKKDVRDSQPSSSRMDQDDDFGTSLALGMATGIPLGRNQAGGLVGALIHESSTVDVPVQDQHRHDQDDSGSNHSHSSGGESHSHSYGGSDSDGSSSYGGSDSSSSSSDGGGGSD